MLNLRTSVWHAYAAEGLFVGGNALSSRQVGSGGRWVDVCPSTNHVRSLSEYTSLEHRCFIAAMEEHLHGP